MSEPAYRVGYSRPPVGTRFKKGQSGNPSGKSGPKKRLKRAFDTALGEALNADRWELKEARPTRVIEALARKVTLDALDGRSSAQRLVLSVLDGEESALPDEKPLRSTFAEATAERPAQGAALRQAQGEALRQAQGEGRNAKESRDTADEEEEEDDEEEGEKEEFTFSHEQVRRIFGNNYEPFKERIDAAVAARDMMALAEIAYELDTQGKFPAAGNSAGNL